MEKRLKLFTYVDGINDTPFPNKEWQVEINAFEYHASRMGGAPYISASIKYRSNIDKMWNDKVYAVFNGEKYFVINTPSSKKSNTDARYEYEILMLSEREKLNHIYFIDAVQGDSGIDKVKSNTTKVQFYGNISEFISRLNASMSYSNVGYTAVLDSGISSDVKDVSFQDKYILEALQYGFEVFNIPYYFKGTVIHFGMIQDSLPEVFKYGAENSLLSISKNNANAKVINRITGMGGTENIPYFYPNKTPKGDVKVVAGSGNMGVTQSDFKITNLLKFAEKFGIDDMCVFREENLLPPISITDAKVKTRDELKNYTLNSLYELGAISQKGSFVSTIDATFYVIMYVERMSRLTVEYECGFSPSYTVSSIAYTVAVCDEKLSVLPQAFENGDFVKEGKFVLSINVKATIVGNVENTTLIPGALKFSIKKNKDRKWMMNDKVVYPSDFGIEVSGVPIDGDYFRQEVSNIIPFVPNLMPPIYRESFGSERFYNAKNNTYRREDDSFYRFSTLYNENNILEGKKDFADIKPTIKGMKNLSGERIDMFADFAYDRGDSDEIDEEGNYIHPYFFAKLKRINGENGFNMFDQSNEKQTMQISMTSGVCGACNFEIGVDKETRKNPVQTSPLGDLLRDDEGRVVIGKPMDSQNDTIHNEVWIALKKDDSTYSAFKPMPNAHKGLRPSTGDTFVILGITLPQAYITAAEERLKNSILEYMENNNVEKFSFAIDFSKIYFSENPDILNKLNENSRIVVEYDNTAYPLYVDEYTYSIDEDDALPKVSVSLSDTLSAGTSTIQNMLNGVKEQILSTLTGREIFRLGMQYFLRKDVSDGTNYLLRLLGGAEFGQYDKKKQGGKIDKNGNAELANLVIRGFIESGLIQSKGFKSGALGTGYLLKEDETTGKSYLEVDELYVRMKAFFTQLEIRKLSYAGGNWIFSPSGMTCSSVEDLGNAYRCFFTNKEDDVIITNDFKENDLVTSREFNIKSGVSENVSNRYYWRKCVGVGPDFIDLSKNDCDPNPKITNDSPKAGDSMITLGNSTDISRQNAIIISTMGDGSPSITQHTGIKTYSLKDTEKTRISPTKNIFTGEFHFTSGGNIKDDIDNANKAAQEALNNVQSAVDSAKQAADNAKKAEEAATQAQNEATEAKNNVKEAVDSANKANEELDKISSDKWVSPPEKKALKQQKADIEAELAEITADANKYGIPSGDASLSAYTTAAQKAISTINYYTTDTPKYIPVLLNGENKYANISVYYTKRTPILELISQKAQELANKAKADAEKAKQEAESAKKQAQDAYNKADDAIQKAVLAKEEADKANNMLADIANDAKLTPSEKLSVKKEWEIIQSELQKNIDTAKANKVSSTDYNNKYNSLKAYIEPLLADMSKTDDINGQVFRDTFKAYYDARTDLLNTIATTTRDDLNDAINKIAENIKFTQAIKKELEEAKKQIDGSITSWFLDDKPTLENKPANEWISEDAKNMHIGDLYYDKEGSAYRFDKKDGVHQWIPITNTKIIEALANAKAAQETANHKRRVFVKQPGQDSAYDEGDLWVNATYTGKYNNDLLRCKTPKESGDSFDINHWELATRYTDDSKAEEAIKNAAESAAAAERANSMLADIANDAKLTASEKLSVKKEWEIIQSEVEKNITAATDSGVPSDTYKNSYDSLKVYITPLLADMSTTSDINGTEFRNKFKSYYDARTDLFNAIAKKAQDEASNALSNAQKAEEAAKNADKAAKDAQAKMKEWSADGVISPLEKQSLKDEMARIKSEKEQIVAAYSKYNLGTPQSLIDAYNLYYGQLSDLTKNTQSTDAIPDTFDDNQLAYYNARKDALNAIADATKNYADGVIDRLDIGGRNLLLSSEKNSADGTQSPYEYGYTSYSISTNIINGIDYILSVGKSVVTQGSTSSYSIGLYNSTRSSWIDGLRIFSVSENQQYAKIHASGISDGDSVYVFIYSGIAGVDTHNIMDFYYVKLERGNKATDWTPAPEDLKNYVDGVIREGNWITQGEFEANNNHIKGEINGVKESIVTDGKNIGLLQEQMTSQVEITNGLIKSSVTKETFNTLDKTVKEQGTKITQTEKDIKAQAEEITTTKENVSKNTAEIALLPTKIETSVRSEVDNIQIGGRNLLLDTARHVKNRDYVLTSYEVVPDANIEAGKEYTISLDGIIHESGITGFYINVYNNPFPALATITQKDSNGRYSASFTMPYCPAYTHIGVYSYPIGTYKVSECWNVKLEEGNKATSWTPAHEDGIFEAKEYTESRISQTSNDIRAEVESTKTYVDGKITEQKSLIDANTNSITNKVWMTDVDKLGKIVASQGSLIEANKKEIGLKVYNSDFNGKNIVSKINLNTDSALIDASKIDLIGKVTFSMWDKESKEKLNAIEIQGENSKNKLAELANDGKLTPEEKRGVYEEVKKIDEEKPKIVASATEYGINNETACTEYVSAYDALKAYLNTIPSYSVSSLTSDIVRSNFNNNFANYFNKRDNLLFAIYSKAKALADEAKTHADGLSAADKNAMAKNLGYANYADMVAEATKGNTIIQGGYIKTELIDVDNLIATNINAKTGTIADFKISEKALTYKNPLGEDFTIDTNGISFGRKNYDKDRWSHESGLELHYGNINMLRDTKIRGLKLGETGINDSEISWTNGDGNTRSNFSNIIIINDSSGSSVYLPSVTSNTFIFVKKMRTGKVVLRTRNSARFVASNSMTYWNSYDLDNEVSIIFVYVTDIDAWITYWCQ